MITNKNYSPYRSPEDIYNIIQVLFDSFVSSIEYRAGKREQIVLEKLKKLDLEISPQLMEVFEAPLNNAHFKDLVEQSIVSIFLNHIDRSFECGVLTKKEHILMHLVIEN